MRVCGKSTFVSSLAGLLASLLLPSLALAGPPDGRPDVLFPGSATLCEGDGAGGFACTDIAGAADPTRAPAVADLNRDSLPDMIFGASSANACLSDGAGGFTCAAIAESSFNATLGAGDFDGDGHADLVVGDNAAGTNRFCANDGSGDYSDAKCTTFATAVPHSTEGTAVGELNGDGNLDVVFAHRFGSPAAEACLGDGTGGFICQTMAGATGSYYVPNIGDLNGDGHLDVTLAWELAADTAVCLNDGAGNFTCASDNRFGDAEEGAIGDVDGDGNTDIVWALSDDGGPGLNVCLGDGTGAVTGFACTADPTHDYAVRSVQLADLDGDANLDAAIYVVESGANNKTCLGDGAGGFSCSDVADAGTCNSGSCSGRNIVIADITGSAAPTLSIADAVPAAELSTVDVDVTFTPAGSAIAAAAFSIDYDEACLAFDETDADVDGLPDSITFHGGADFSLTALHDAADTDGELDLSVTDLSPPIAALGAGPLLTVTFTATCSPSTGTTTTASLAFSSAPAASFSDTAAMDVSGTTEDGSVEIFAGPRGDCNGNGGVAAADLVAEALEIFDDDGTFWADVPGSTFAGSPVGCDANADQAVTAGDISCTVLLIFGGACGGGGEQLTGPGPAAAPVLGLGRILRKRGAELTIPLYFSPGEHAISSLAFSLDLEGRGLVFDPADRDRDGAPDAVRFPGGRPDLVHVRFDAAGRPGALDVALSDFESTLAEGVLLEITVRRPGRGAASGLRFASPAPSFGDRAGRDVPGLGLELAAGGRR